MRCAPASTSSVSPAASLSGCGASTSSDMQTLSRVIVTATCPIGVDTEKVETLVTDLGLSAATPLEPADDEHLITFIAGLGFGVILAEETTVSDNLAA